MLVVLSLRGGFDGLQAIVPGRDPDYLTWRPNVGIPHEPPCCQLDSTFGMHPAMAPLQAVLGRPGPSASCTRSGMAEPNRSHFAAMEEMERAAPGTSVRTGWIDRVLGTARTRAAFQGVQMGIEPRRPPPSSGHDPRTRDVVGRLVRAGRRLGRRTQR